MRVNMASRFASVGLLVGVTVLSSGCGLLDVRMTSAPESVLSGDPVTFDIKLTNRSQCPVEPAAASLVAFIPVGEFDTFVFGDLPEDLPPQVLQFIEEVRQFLDALCVGGDPPIPDVPVLPALASSCRRGNGEIVCEVSGLIPAREGSNDNVTFATLGDRAQCELESGTMRCRLRIPLPMSPANTTAGALTQPLNCLTADQFSNAVDFDALCFVGTFPAVEGLEPGEMAMGQVTLPARGAGVVRSLVVAMTTNEDEAGVCKGGTDAGQACNRTDMTACPGSTCGEGICVGGDNNDRGCDVATQTADCPNGGTCAACADVSTNGFLPLDCTTTTVIALEVAPAMSPWRLASLGAILLAAGSLWLRRRRGRG